MPKLTLPSPSDGTAIALIYNRLRQLVNALHIERGNAVFQTDNAQTRFLDVAFDTPYSSAPIVNATAVTALPNALSVSVVNVTTTGCRIMAYRHASGSGISTIAWVAVP